MTRYRRLATCCRSVASNGLVVVVGDGEGQRQDFGSGGGHHGDGPLDGAADVTGPRLPDPAEQVDERSLRPRGFSDDARALLEHLWALMGMPCGKYLVVMPDLWLPLFTAAGDLDKPLVTEASVAELKATALPGENRMPRRVAGTLPGGFPARAVRTHT